MIIDFYFHISLTSKIELVAVWSLQFLVFQVWATITSAPVQWKWEGTWQVWRCSRSARMETVVWLCPEMDSCMDGATLNTCSWPRSLRPHRWGELTCHPPNRNVEGWPIDLKENGILEWHRTSVILSDFVLIYELGFCMSVHLAQQSCITILQKAARWLCWVLFPPVCHLSRLSRVSLLSSQQSFWAIRERNERIQCVSFKHIWDARW